MSLISILKRKSKKLLFTTPSHSGNFCILHKFYQWYKADISEVDTFMPEEALEKAEILASKVYGTKFTKFLTNGSTSGIICAVLASNAKKILIWNNAHPCHKNACLLAGADYIEYEIPFDKELGLYKAISSKQVNELIKKYAPEALIITSPTYEGFVSNIEEISNICKANNTILIVDEAHGALYPFSDDLPQSAVKYADFTVQSLHKTAGGINPTALLHSNKIDPTNYLKMINTTSPSYPMLTTIEANIKFLNSTKGRKLIKDLIQNIKELNLPQLNDDPTKILLQGGENLSKKLYDIYHIEDEKTNKKTTLLLCGLGTGKKKLERLKKVLKNFQF